VTSRLIHPNLMTSLARDFFPQVAGLYAPVKAQNTAGEETITFPVETHADVECRVSPAKGSERRRQNLKYAEVTHTLLIQGQFSDVTEEWQAVVDGVAYDIQVPELDAEGIMTSLFCRIVR